MIFGRLTFVAAVAVTAFVTPAHVHAETRSLLRSGASADAVTSVGAEPSFLEGSSGTKPSMLEGSSGTKPSMLEGSSGTKPSFVVDGGIPSGGKPSFVAGEDGDHASRRLNRWCNRWPIYCPNK